MSGIWNHSTQLINEIWNHKTQAIYGITNIDTLMMNENFDYTAMVSMVINEIGYVSYHHGDERNLQSYHPVDEGNL